MRTRRSCAQEGNSHKKVIHTRRSFTQEGHPTRHDEYSPVDVISARLHFGQREKVGLLHLGNDSLEGFEVVHGEVGKNLTVDFDTSLVESSHQLAVAHAFHAGSSVDTLNPQGAEAALLILTIAIGVGQTLLPSVLGNGPDVLAGTKVAAGELQDSFSLCT